MTREALDKWCERGILGLVLAILVIGPLAFGATRAPGFITVETLTICVMLLWGVRLWLSPRPQILWPPICWAVVAFTIYAIVRYRFSDIEYVARQDLVHIIVYALLFFAILNNLHGQEAVQLISITLVILAMLISMYALFQFLTGSQMVWNIRNTSYPHRATGTYICPNHLGGFLEMILPLGLAYIVASRLGATWKIVLSYASVAILAGIAVTVSRGSWISTAVAMIALLGVLAFQRAYRLTALALLVVFMGAGTYVAFQTPLLKLRSKDLQLPQHTELDTRILIWQSAVGVWQENPWWGVGPGHFDFRFGQHRPADLQLRPVHTHNDFLNALTDWGVAGVVLIASAWALLAWGVFKTWRHVRGTPSDLGATKNRNKFAFVLGASIGLLAIFVHSAVDFNMYIPANAILAITLMALLSSYLRFATERYWVGVSVAPKVLVTVLLVAGVGFVGEQGVRQGREYACLVQASTAQTFSPEMIERFGKAFEVEPTNPDTAAVIGEAYWVQSHAGPDNYQELAQKAMDWFNRSLKLNPWRSHTYLQYGMCLDWLGRSDEAQTYFDRAVQLDPNNYYTMNGVGAHYMEIQDYAAARLWFERSQRLEWAENPVAPSYLEIIGRRLLMDATNGIAPKADANPQ